MLFPPIPDDEAQRIEALNSLSVLYSPAEERFDRITRIAQRLFDMPIALISLVSSDKQWFKSHQGLAVCETDREISFCGHAINSDETFVIANALKDPDFSDNPLVTGDPNIRFYAGQPVRYDRRRIGTLCLIDTKPRQLRPRDYDSLRALTAWVEVELKSSRTFAPHLLAMPHTNEERHGLIDPATGCLNERGLKRTIKTIEKSSSQAQAPQTLKLSFNTDSDSARIPLLQAGAQALRAELGESAIVAFMDDGSFAIIPVQQSIVALEAVRLSAVEAMEIRLPAILNREFDSNYKLEASPH